MKYDILIPTCKSMYEISPMIGEIARFDHDANIIASCDPGSAAHNRNICLEQAKSELVIMVDDDISGFRFMWANDLAAMLKSSKVLYMSARLVNEQGQPMNVIGSGHAKATMSEYTSVQIAPSACIAFRNDGTRFCEEYIGSGFEDIDFHLQLKKKYGKEKVVVINNMVRLTHKNEMKNQLGKFYEHNKAVFDRRWPKGRIALGI